MIRVFGWLFLTMGVVAIEGVAALVPTVSLKEKVAIIGGILFALGALNFILEDWLDEHR